jgi:spore maturation protein CgeB
MESVATERPDVVFVDNSYCITRATLRKLRAICDPLLVYHSPDDMTASHNLTWPVRLTFPEWDLFFTTKTFNVPELRARGVREPILVGNAFDPDFHRPLAQEEVGENYERFDLVFVGTFEEDRFRYIRKLVDAGYSIAIYGSPARRFSRGWATMRHDRIMVGPPAIGADYSRAMHHGKAALCFLRKMNRDQITTRSIEIPGMGRPMIAEKTQEHDDHFVDGSEYLGFRDETELLDKVRILLADDALRSRIARAGRARCFASGYTTADRGVEMIAAINKAAAARASRRNAVDMIAERRR